MSNDSTTLYLRGMSRALVREAKAEAARQGKTLAAIVSESLAQTLARGPRRNADRSASKKDWAWYERNHADLLERYRGEYVAVVDQAVVDHDADFTRLATRVFARLEGRAVLMPRVSLTPKRVIRLRSPRALVKRRVPPT
ncbi:MAG: hypothetical protein KIT84_28945 [Labilithrix sp.]|nr:hypothetical protein [Labilithrix sp.]MCW5815088.1 hypothetical protein [Labilithrix sp.]